MVKIIKYEDKYEEDFRKLNLEWLDHYGLTESHDLMVLNNPKATILDGGGYIFLAILVDAVVGSAALMNEGNGKYELAKMTVAETQRGKGIGRLLIEKCLDTARQIGAKQISLFSNHQLLSALHLYESYGFRHIEVKDAPYSTADVKMELTL
jgi:GNAT superfamily N-acetyltransferase